MYPRKARKESFKKNFTRCAYVVEISALFDFIID